MVSNEIRNCGIALGALLHEVTEEQAALLRLIKSNLIAAADMAEELEANMPCAALRCGLCGPNTRTR